MRRLGYSFPLLCARKAPSIMTQQRVCNLKAGAPAHLTVCAHIMACTHTHVRARLPAAEAFQAASGDGTSANTGARKRSYNAGDAGEASTEGLQPHQRCSSTGAITEGVEEEEGEEQGTVGEGPTPQRRRRAGGMQGCRGSCQGIGGCSHIRCLFQGSRAYCYLLHRVRSRCVLCFLWRGAGLALD